MPQHKHTPWKILGNSGKGRFHISDSNNAPIATTENDNGEKARLIAAAPELLEALKMIADLPGGITGSVLTFAKDTAQAAIAKATNN